MERVTQKDECGYYYLVGDGIYSDWGTPDGALMDGKESDHD